MGGLRRRTLLSFWSTQGALCKPPSRYKETEVDVRAAHKPKLGEILSPRVVTNLKRPIRSKPGTCIKMVTEARGESTTTMERAIKGDLGYKFFRLRVRHLLTLLSSQTADTWGSSWMRNCSTWTHPQHKNSKWICQDPVDIPMVFKSKNPASVMLLGVISSENRVMSPHLFPVGPSTNKEVYKGSSRRWRKGPGYKGQLLQPWLLGAIPHFWPPSIKPPNSPNCITCDYYLWDKVYEDACKTSHKNLTSLKAAITRSMAS